MVRLQGHKSDGASVHRNLPSKKFLCMGVSNIADKRGKSDLENRFDYSNLHF